MVKYAIFSHYEAFLTLKRTMTGQQELFRKKSKILSNAFPEEHLYKMSEKSLQGFPRKVAGRTDRPTKVIS